MSELTRNDRATLWAIEQACGEGGEYDSFVPHGSAHWTAIRRLLKAGLVESAGFGECCSCVEPHESESFTLTEAGQEVLEQ